MNVKFFIGISIVAAVLLFGLGWCSKPCPEIKESTTSNIRRDTIKQIEYLPVYRDTGSVIVRYRVVTRQEIDTVINPLLAGYDTLDFPVRIDSMLYLTPSFEMGYHNISEVTKDTHDIKFLWPEAKVLFTEYPAPREKIIEKVKETITIQLDRPLPWYKSDWFQWGLTGVAFIGGVYIGVEAGK